MSRVIFRARVPGIPPTATAQGKGIGRRRDGRPFVYTKKPQQREEANAFAVLAQSRTDAPPVEGPCACFVYLVFPYRKSERKSIVKAGVEVPMAQKPDADNAIKAAVLDVLTKLQVWRDDKQCSLLLVGKARGPSPFWAVRVEELAEDREIPLRDLILDDGGGGHERAAGPECGGARRLGGNDTFQKRPTTQLCLRQVEGGAV